MYQFFRKQCCLGNKEAQSHVSHQFGEIIQTLDDIKNHMLVLLLGELNLALWNY